MTQPDAPNEAREEKLTEYDEAILMANKALDNPTADPDDDLRTVSRQFLRLIERFEAFEMANRILLKDLRDQLSIEKEFRGNLLKDISNLSDQFSKEREKNTDNYWRSQFSFLQKDYDEQAKQLEKEREMRKELVEGISKFVHHWRIYFNSPKVGQPPNLSDLESLISKASELDKNKT